MYNNRSIIRSAFSRIQIFFRQRLGRVFLFHKKKLENIQNVSAVMVHI